MSFLKTPRSVFFVSDRTGITAELLGKTLLTQFPSADLRKRVAPFVDTVEKARAVVAEINEAARQDRQRPIVFSTLIDDDVRAVVSSANALFLDFLADFIDRLESELGLTASRTLGLSHGMGDALRYQKRMDAVNYALLHDDGANTANYDRAELILTGVSRTGKTPTCLYLAMQYGIRAANYPLTPDDFLDPSLPKPLLAHRPKLFGLTIHAERLAKIRGERKPDSRYASLENCRRELHAAEDLMRRERIPSLDTTIMSVEEIAVSILHTVGMIQRVKS